MEITRVTGSAAAATPAGRAGGDGIGKQAFLQLLLTQLRNQDPLKPMEDREFIAQLAQFNTLEQMQAMQQTMTDVLALGQLSQATSLIGKTVSGKFPSGKEFIGRVVEVRTGADGPMLVTDAGEVALKDVLKVS